MQINEQSIDIDGDMLDSIPSQPSIDIDEEGKEGEEGKRSRRPSSRATLPEIEKNQYRTVGAEGYP